MTTTGRTRIARTIVLLAIAGLFVLLLFGCSNSSSTSSSGSSSSSSSGASTGMPNPMVEVDSPDDFASKLGITMPIPDGTSDATYYIIDNVLADAQFTWNGISFDERMQKGDADEDISGLYYSWKNTKAGTNGGIAYNIYCNEGEAGYAHFTVKNSDGTYTIYSIGSADSAVSTDVLESAVQAIITKL